MLRVEAFHIWRANKMYVNFQILNILIKCSFTGECSNSGIFTLPTLKLRLTIHSISLEYYVIYNYNIKLGWPATANYTNENSLTQKPHCLFVPHELSQQTIFSEITITHLYAWQLRARKTRYQPRLQACIKQSISITMPRDEKNIYENFGANELLSRWGGIPKLNKLWPRARSGNPLGRRPLPDPANSIFSPSRSLRDVLIG